MAMETNLISSHSLQFCPTNRDKSVVSALFVDVGDVVTTFYLRHTGRNRAR